MNHTLAIIFFSTLLFLTLLFVIVLFIVLNKQKKRRQEKEQEEISYKHQIELLETRLQVEEDAKDYISKELHDNVVQILGITRMQMLTSMRIADVMQKDSTIQTSADRLTFAMSQLRALSHSLNGRLIRKIGLIDSVRKELGHIETATDIQFSFEYIEDDLPLDPEQELTLFRIIQEVLNNIIKHAKASEVAIRIMEMGDELEYLHFCICDNGIGMDFENIHKQSGLGMINMDARIRLLNGRLDIEPNEGGGTQFCITVPKSYNDEQD